MNGARAALRINDPPISELSNWTFFCVRRDSVRSSSALIESSPKVVLYRSAFVIIELRNSSDEPRSSGMPLRPSSPSLPATEITFSAKLRAPSAMFRVSGDLRASVTWKFIVRLRAFGRFSTAEPPTFTDSSLTSLSRSAPSPPVSASATLGRATILSFSANRFLVTSEVAALYDLPINPTRLATASSFLPIVPAARNSSKVRPSFIRVTRL